jgi:hypothetical protein
MKKTLLSLLVAVSALPLQAAQQSVGTGNTIVAYWNEVMMQQVRPTRPGPPIAARQMAVVHTCIYDAWAAYDNKALGTRLGASLRRPGVERTDEYKHKAISYAAHACLRNLYPTRGNQIDAALVAAGYPVLTTAVVNSAEDIGLKAAAAVIAYRATDGSNQTGALNGGAAYSDYTGYAPVNTSTVVNDLNRWQPLPPVFPQVSAQKFIAPHWEKVKGFAVTNPAMFDALVPAPEVYPSAGFTQQALDLIDLSANMTDERKAIIELWADGPDSELPPGHWGLIAQWLSTRDNHSIDDDAKMFFAMHNASFDAGIVVWHLKRKYDYVRPITALRTLFANQIITAWGGANYHNPANTAQPFAKQILGKDWSPYNPGSNLTPAFPEYTSGHSVFSRSSADTLGYFKQSNVMNYTATFPAGHSRVEPGFAPFVDYSWTFATFQDAANAAGWSRRYGGIHFEDGDLESRNMGVQVAKLSWCKAVAYFNDRSKHQAQGCTN